MAISTSTSGITDNTIVKQVESLLAKNMMTINAIPDFLKMGYKAQSMRLDI